MSRDDSPRTLKRLPPSEMRELRRIPATVVDAQPNGPTKADTAALIPRARSRGGAPRKRHPRPGPATALATIDGGCPRWRLAGPRPPTSTSYACARSRPGTASRRPGRDPKLGLFEITRRDSGLITHSGLYDGVVAIYDRAGVPHPPMPLHCSGTRSAEAGATGGGPLPVLQVLMGHSNVKTPLRHVDVNDRQKHAAIALAIGGRGSHVAAAPTSGRKC